MNTHKVPTWKKWCDAIDKLLSSKPLIPVTLVEVGETYKTMSGRKIRIICIDKNCPIGYPIIGLVTFGDGEKFSSYTKELEPLVTNAYLGEDLTICI